MAQSLPDPFLALEPFAPWALDRREARYKKRLASSMDEIRAFYDAMRPRMAEIIEHLNSRPLDGMAGQDRCLLLLAAAWMDASRSVEVLGAPDVRYGLEAERFRLRDLAPL